MCTAVRFASPDGSLYFGRNLDWDRAFGQEVFAVPAGFALEWRHLPPSTSSHAVIGTALCPAGYPLFFDCANDAGLAIAGLNFPHTCHYAPEPVEGHTNLASFELMLWVTGNFSTVLEVEAALADVTLTADAYAPDMQPSPLHWMISDARRAIVVEQDADGLHVYRNDAEVLTNEPDFPFQRANLRNYLGISPEAPAASAWGEPFGAGAGLRGVPGDYYPPSRFVKVAAINAAAPIEDGEAACVCRLFRTLGSVAVPVGAAKTGDNTWDKTIYQGGFSSRTGTYYYSTYEDPTIRRASLGDLDRARLAAQRLPLR